MHVYTSAGTYTVKLTVTNADGSNTKTITITITDTESQKFVGTYSATDSCNFGGSPYGGTHNISIVSTGSNTVKINNFAGFATVNAEVGGNLMVIPSQTSSGVTIAGNGIMNDAHTTLYVTYTISIAGYSQDCSFTATKQ
jgi:hypothetical protein